MSGDPSDPTDSPGALFSALEDPEAEPLVLRLMGVDEARRAAPDFLALIELWDRRRGARAVPDWRDVEFTDFQGWHADLTLGEFTGADPDPMFRLAGQGHIELTGRNIAGRRFSEAMPRLYGLQFREHFQRLRDEGLIGLSEGRMAQRDRGYIRIRVLELPFRDGGPEVRRTVHAFRRISS